MPKDGGIHYEVRTGGLCNAQAGGIHSLQDAGWQEVWGKEVNLTALLYYTALHYTTLYYFIIQYSTLYYTNLQYTNQY